MLLTELQPATPFVWVKMQPESGGESGLHNSLQPPKISEENK